MRGREGAGTIASSKSILLVFSCGHSSLSTIVLLVVAELIKGHLPTAHKNRQSGAPLGYGREDFLADMLILLLTLI